MFANKDIKSGNLRSWLWKASKEERIAMARQIASTVEKSDDEMSYFDTANLKDMPKEERTWLAKKIASSVSSDWKCSGRERIHCNNNMATNAKIIC